MHTYTSIHLHVIFATWDREPLLTRAFSVSRSQLETVRRYIERQEEHHRRVPFAEESNRFYRAHGIEVSPAFAGSR